MGGGGQKDSTTTNRPWGPTGRALQDVYGGAQDVFNQGGFGAIADQSPYTLQAQQGMADRALGGGSGLIDNALGQANATVGGEYLDLGNNPFFQDAIQYAQQPVIDQWNQQVLPGIQSAFSGQGGAGALGSGAFANAVNQGGDALVRNLAGAATTAGANAYGQERGLQQGAIGMAPGLEGAGYGNLAQLGQVGAQQDAYQQALAREQAGNIGGYANIIQGMPNFGTTNQSGGGQEFNPWATGLGAAALGGSMFLSDMRLKEGLQRVGTMPTGEGIYDFRYLGNSNIYRGVLAQEIRENYPEAVFEIDDGILGVDYSLLPDCGWLLPGAA